MLLCELLGGTRSHTARYQKLNILFFFQRVLLNHSNLRTNAGSHCQVFLTTHRYSLLLIESVPFIYSNTFYL